MGSPPFPTQQAGSAARLRLFAGPFFAIIDLLEAGHLNFPLHPHKFPGIGSGKLLEERFSFPESFVWTGILSEVFL